MPSSCKQCSVSRSADTVDDNYTFSSQVALLAHIPRESHSEPYGFDCIFFSESAMAVGTGLEQLFKGVGHVRSIVSVIEPVRATTRCRSLAWLYPRRFSSRFLIGNFETEFKGLDQMRYPKIKTPTFIYLTIFPFTDHQEDSRVRETRDFIAARSAEVCS
jgi:hypothetical protein